MDFKNVQRRVYDALNVLSALRIIYKIRNRVRYIGFAHLADLNYETGFPADLDSLISLPQHAASGFEGQLRENAGFER